MQPLFRIKQNNYVDYLPVPCCEGASLGGYAKGLYLAHMYSCIYTMSTTTQVYVHTNK